MIFEYDNSKSQTNKVKHGIDFEEAKGLWDDPYSFDLPSLHNKDEPRFLLLGRIDTRHYAAIITNRNGKVRIISVRRARKKEIELYESIRTR